MITEKKLKELTFLLTKMSRRDCDVVYKFASDLFAKKPTADAYLEAIKPQPQHDPNLTLVEPMQHERGVPTEAIRDLFNTHCTKLPAVKEFTARRRRAVIARWKENVDRQTLAWWKRYFSFINDKCPFLTGDNDRNWRANFDFVTKAENMAKIVENFYVERRRSA